MTKPTKKAPEAASNPKSTPKPTKADGASATKPTKRKRTRKRPQRTKRRKELTGSLLLDIETAVAKGAETNGQIAKAIGWGESTLKNYRYGKGKDPRYAAAIEPIETAIKKGSKRRRSRLLSEAEDALSELLRHDTFEERRIERKTVPVGKPGADGAQGTKTETKQVVTVKRRIPNAIVAMFVAVNASRESIDGGEAVRWKSINKVLERAGQDKAAVLDAIDRMVKDAKP
jgi:hypothetical protein